MLNDERLNDDALSPGERIALTETFHRVDHAVEHFQLLVEPCDFQDLAVNRVGGRNFQIAVFSRKPF